MLALYDKTSEAPAELKYIELLYQPRGKPPIALNNSFDEEMVNLFSNLIFMFTFMKHVLIHDLFQRDTMRSGPPIGAMAPGDRYGIGRGTGRGLNVNDPTARGRGGRTSFARQLGGR